MCLQVNFDPERFVEYITEADDFLELIRTKLAQAGVQGRPTAAQLPWFDLQVGFFFVWRMMLLLPVANPERYGVDGNSSVA
jgi:hypothetical protein